MQGAREAVDFPVGLQESRLHRRSSRADRHRLKGASLVRSMRNGLVHSTPYSARGASGKYAENEHCYKHPQGLSVNTMGSSR